MSLQLRYIRLAALTLFITSTAACTVVKVVDAVASTAVGVTATAVKTTGKAVGAVIPDGDDKDTKDSTDDSSEPKQKD